MKEKGSFTYSRIQLINVERLMETENHWGERWKETQEEGDICMPMTNSC